MSKESAGGPPGPAMIVSYYFPPLNFPRSIRIHYLLRAFERMGRRVVGLTARLENWGVDESLTDLHGAEVVRVHSRLFRFSVRVHLLPHLFLGWLVLPTLRGIVEVHRRRPAYLLGVGLPFNSPIIACVLSKVSGVPLFLELGDPWSMVPDPTHPIRGLKKALVDAIEACVFAQARAVFVTTERVRQDYARAYPDWADRIHIARNGFSGRAVAEAPGVPLPGEGARVLHMGAYYPIRVGLRPLMEAAGALRSEGTEVTFVFVGPFVGERPATGLITLPQQDLRDAIGMMKSADLLLAYGNRGGALIPSKVYWYVGTGRPTLIIVEGRDVMEGELGGLPQVRVVQNDAAAIGAAMRELLSMRGGAAAPARFDWDLLDEDYLRLLDRLAAEG